MSSKRDGATVAGVGVAACVVCCAGPILGFIAALSVGTVLSVFMFGAFGLVAAAIVGAFWYRRRRRQRCTPVMETVAIASPTIRTPT